MSLGDLALGVLHDRRQRAVQDPGAPARGQWRTVASAGDALSGRLHADERHRGVIDKGGEHPDGVGAAAHAGDDPVGQSSFAQQDLPP
jgi:hypothetical protein